MVKTSDRAVLGARLVFYGALLLLTGLIQAGVLGALGPAGLMKHISADSESYVFAIVLCAWIEWGAWRLRGSRLAITAAALCLVFAGITVFTLTADLPSSVRTLNESFFALAVLIPYVALRRPLGVWPAVGSVLLAVGIAVSAALSPHSIVVSLAEGMTILVLAPWVFDVLDRELLTRIRSGVAGRYVVYATLVLVPVAVVGLGVARRTDGGFVNGVLHYLGRSQESFVGMLLVAVYLAVVLGLRRSRSEVTDVAVGSTANSPTSAMLPQ